MNYQELKEWRDRLAGKTRKVRPTNQNWNRARNRQTQPAGKPGFKICTRCKSEKSTEEFYRNSGTKDGRQNHCKNCHKGFNKISKNAKLRKRRNHVH